MFQYDCTDHVSALSFTTAVRAQAAVDMVVSGRLIFSSDYGH